MRKNTVKRIAGICALLTVMVFLLPIAELLATMIRSPLSMTSNQGTFWRGVTVQLLVTAAGVIYMTTVVLMAAYGLSLLHGRQASFVRFVFVLPMVFQGGLIPTYIVVRSIGLIDHPLVMILAERIDIVLILAASVAFSRASTLREAASMDGADPATTMIRVVLPAYPQLVATIVTLSALRYWNSWYPAFLYINSSWLRPAQNVLRSMVQATGTTYGGELLRSVGADSQAQLALYATLLLLPGITLVTLVQKAVNSTLGTVEWRDG